MHRWLSAGLAVSCCFLGVLAGLDGHCPPLGPVLPQPTQPSTHRAVPSAATALSDVLEQFTASFNSSAVAIGVKSIHESNLLFEYAYTPPIMDPRSVQKVDSDTVFRLGSLTKVFPVLALLKLHDKGVSLDDPITKYVPELRDLNRQAREQTPIWTVNWDDVTLGSLASHLGGIASDMITDIAPFGNFSVYGYPQPNASKALGCAGFLGTPGCGRDVVVFFEHFGQRAPVQLPFSPQTVYSNIAFPILAFAVESLTNQSFASFVQNEILNPINMTRTFAATPNDTVGFIPANDVFWDAQLGFAVSEGGFYSTINDLHRLGDAILGHKLLNPVQTRKWLKPVTGTSSSGLLMGQPWEIFRASNLTTDGRVIDIYTKTGDLITYHSVLALIPDYDLVMTVLVSAPMGARGEASGQTIFVALAQLLKGLLPAVEQAGKNQAQASHAGTYVDRDTNSTLTLTLADTGPGLAVAEWVVRGVDVPRTDPGTTLPPPTPPVLDPPMRYRLYPTTIESPADSSSSSTCETEKKKKKKKKKNEGSGGSARRQESWRAVGTTDSAEDVEKRDALFPWLMNSCITWAKMDRVTYNMQARDHFVFDLDEEGKATGVELVGYGVTLVRQG
ncbi:Beta-lactamase 2 [Madurella fahalii]|uniref:Beta-lactamase 2 n=1 Tax=Madurella fahalii TaxID=1157608 RepID=A0ABQ0GJ87_9PEZI